MVKDIKLILDNTGYSRGSTVQGRLMVNVDKPKKYHSIVVRLWGGAKVLWTEIHGRKVVKYKNLETYISVYTTVWELENSPTGDLSVGEHYFPFSFQLPPNAPPSFEGLHGDVRYEIEAEIHQKGVINKMAKSKHAVKASLDVRGENADDILPFYNNPKMLDKSKRLQFLCFDSGTVSATVSVPRTCFSLGEAMPISMHMSNQSSRRIRVASALVRKDTFIASEGDQMKVKSCAVKTVSSPVRPGVVMPYDGGPLTIPTEARVTMRNCSCIRVEYTLVVEILIPWSFNMKLKVPVFIAAPGEEGRSAMEQV